MCFSDIKNPIILRRLDISNKAVHGIKNVTIYNLVNSSFWAKNDFWNYPQLNLSTYLPKAMPWNCEVLIDIFSIMQGNMTSEYRHPLSKGNRSAALSYNIFPSFVPAMRIIVLHREDTSFPLLSLTTVAIIQGEELNISAILHDAFFFATTNVKKSSHAKIPMHEEYIEGNLTLIRLCYRFGEVSMSQIIKRTVVNFQEKFASMSTATCNNLPNRNNMLWVLPDLDQKTESKLIYSMVDSFHGCGKSVTRRESEVRLSETKWIATSYGKVWLSIMGNYTYFSGVGRFPNLCFNGKNHTYPTGYEVTGFLNQIYFGMQPTHSNFAASGTLSPAVVSGVSGNLKLVSCGYRELERWSFSEFLQVFEPKVWIFIVISTVYVSVVLWKVASADAVSLTQTVLGSIKAILELGDPFPAKLINSRRCHWVTGTFLVMTIILSNAYKNTNVYNMIIPRRPVPY